jgi:hypothetical protein
MIETLMGTLFGGLFRLAPEVLKWVDRKDERKHELSMFDKQLEADTLKATSGQKLAEIEANKSLGLADMQAMIAAVNAQSQMTGIPVVDGINSLMRPLITFWWVIVLYTGSMIAQFWVIYEREGKAAESLLGIWGKDEKAISGSIIGFWFVDRSLKYGGLK